MLQKNFWALAITLFCSWSTGCAPTAYTITSDAHLCPLPPPQVFSSVGVDIQVAKLMFGTLTTEGAGFKIDPKVISLASQAAQDEQIWAYLFCLEDMRKGYTKSQTAWFRRSRDFLKTNPTSEMFMAWQTNNPFPSADFIGDNVSQKSKQADTQKWSELISGFDLSNWEKIIWGSGNAIHFVDYQNEKIAKIESTMGRNALWIESMKIKGPGHYKVSAKIKAENLIQRGKEYYERGKFQVVIIENGRDKEWPADDDFLSTDGWVNKSVDIELASHETAVFRIGLQRTQGVVYVRDVHVHKR